MRGSSTISIERLDPERESAACNVCFAQNYKSRQGMPSIGRYDENIHRIMINHTEIRLCGDCLETLRKTVAEYQKGDDKTCTPTRSIT